MKNFDCAGVGGRVNGPNLRVTTMISYVNVVTLLRVSLTEEVLI